MTRELVANLLSMPREGVTEAVANLKEAGLVGYHRTHSTALDRAGLEARLCECYAGVRNEFNRLLPEAAMLRPVAKGMCFDSNNRDGQDATSVENTHELLLGADAGQADRASGKP